MTSSWPAFLAARGAHSAADTPADFDRRAVGVTDNHLMHLGDIACLRVEGKDAVTFLSGQLTSDLRLMDPASTMLGAWCTPAGRVRVVLQTWATEGGLCLALPRVLATTTLKALSRFVLRADVRLHEADTVQIGLSGSGATTLLHEALGETPAAVLHSGAVAAVRLPGTVDRYLLSGTPEAIESLWARLEADTPPVASRHWTLLDILAGIPRVLPATQERYLPQMLNLDALGGLSFEKGCYPGQEIIARLKYRGEVKRRTYLARVHSPAPPDPATPVMLGERQVGETLEAAPHPAGGHALLAVIEVANAGDALAVAGVSPAPLALEPLPYSVGNP